MNRQETLCIRKGLALAIVRSRREAESTIKRLREQVATLDEELERYRRRERDVAAASEAERHPVAFQAAGVVPLECRPPARISDNAGVGVAGSPFLQDQPDADVTHHKHLAELLKSVAAETAALEHSSLQEEDVRFLAEVRAMQLAAASSAQVNSTANLAGQPAGTQTPHSVDVASHGAILCSRSSQAAIEGLPRSTLDHAPGCGGSASALTAVVDFLLHGVLSMQPGSLQTSYAGSALSYINAVQAAWTGECCALGPILDRLSSGLIAKAAQAGASCGGIATDFLQEFLETHLTGQAVFRVAAAELRSASDALSDKAREAEASVHGQMQKIEVLCGVLDAALLRLPHWLSQPDLASSPSPTQDTLSQAMECILQAHTACEAWHRQAAPGISDRLKALAVQLLMILQHVRGSS